MNTKLLHSEMFLFCAINPPATDPPLIHRDTYAKEVQTLVSAREVIMIEGSEAVYQKIA
jgi:hypothetical protein